MNKIYAISYGYVSIHILVNAIFDVFWAKTVMIHVSNENPCVPSGQRTIELP